MPVLKAREKLGSKSTTATQANPGCYPGQVEQRRMARSAGPRDCLALLSLYQALFFQFGFTVSLRSTSTFTA